MRTANSKMRWCNWKINRPDSAWSWVALLSSTLIMSATFGFLANFGIFYSRFLVEYKESREKTGLFSLHTEFF